MQKGTVKFIAGVALILLKLTGDSVAQDFESTKLGTGTDASDMGAAFEEQNEYKDKTNNELIEYLKNCQSSLVEKNTDLEQFEKSYQRLLANKNAAGKKKKLLISDADLREIQKLYSKYKLQMSHVDDLNGLSATSQQTQGLLKDLKKVKTVVNKMITKKPGEVSDTKQVLQQCQRTLKQIDNQISQWGKPILPLPVITSENRHQFITYGEHEPVNYDLKVDPSKPYDPESNPLKSPENISDCVGICAYEFNEVLDEDNKIKESNPEQYKINREKHTKDFADCKYSKCPAKFK